MIKRKSGKNILARLLKKSTYIYLQLREDARKYVDFKEDLMKERFHPRNLRKFGSWGHNGGIDDDDE